MRRRKKTPPATMIIFAAAIALSFLAAAFLPIPEKFQKLAFFLMVIGLSLAGVFIAGKITRR